MLEEYGGLSLQGMVFQNDIEAVHVRWIIASICLTAES